MAPAKIAKRAAKIKQWGMAREKGHGPSENRQEGAASSTTDDQLFRDLGGLRSDDGTAALASPAGPSPTTIAPGNRLAQPPQADAWTTIGQQMRQVQSRLQQADDGPDTLRIQQQIVKRLEQLLLQAPSPAGRSAAQAGEAPQRSSVGNARTAPSPPIRPSRQIRARRSRRGPRMIRRGNCSSGRGDICRPRCDSSCSLSVRNSSCRNMPRRSKLTIARFRHPRRPCHKACLSPRHPKTATLIWEKDGHVSMADDLSCTGGKRTGSQAAAVCLTILTACACQAEPAANPETTGRQMMTAQTQSAIDRGLGYLVRHQNDDGAFDGSGYRRNVAVCSLAGLAFMSSGSTPARGPYGAQIDRLCRLPSGSCRGQRVHRRSGKQQPRTDVWSWICHTVSGGGLRDVAAT